MKIIDNKCGKSNISFTYKFIIKHLEWNESIILYNN